MRKGREAHVAGSDNGEAKITEAQALEIRRRYSAGGVTQKELGTVFGLKQPQISEIIRKTSWKHLLDPSDAP